LIDLRAGAHEWARAAWPVVPCRPGGKVPLTPTGFRAASTDAVTVERWWSDCPRANVAVALPPGVMVLDVDRHGEDGFATLGRLEAEHGPLTRTYTVATGGGGQHRWFAVPTGARVVRRVGVLPGIDVLVGGSGAVVVPPSVRYGGTAYRAVDESPIAPAPGWLVRLAAPPSPKPWTPVAESGSTVGRIAGLRRAVATAPVGSRNEIAYWAGCVAVEIGVDPLEVIFPAALEAGLDEREVRAVCASARRRVAGIGR